MISQRNEVAAQWAKKLAALQTDPWIYRHVVEIHAGKVIFTENGTGESERIRPRDRVVVTPLPGAYDGMPVRETEAVNGAKDKGRTPPSESGSSPNEGERRLREESALPEAKIPSKKTPSAVPGPSQSTGDGR